MIRTLWSVLLLLAAGCMSLGMSDRPQATNSPPQKSSALPSTTEGQYAPNDICQTCHQEVWDKHFAGTPHRCSSRVVTRMPVLPWSGASPRRWRWRRHQDHSLRDTEPGPDSGHLH